MSVFSQTNAQIAFSHKFQQKNWHKIWKRAIHKTEICKEQAQKTSKFQSKQAQKQGTRKSSNVTATPQINKPKFAGKPHGWQHWQKRFRKLSPVTVTSQIEIVTSVDIPNTIYFVAMRLPFNATCCDVASWRNDRTDWKQAFAKFINLSSLNHLGGNKKIGGALSPNAIPWLRAWCALIQPYTQRWAVASH